MASLPTTYSHRITEDISYDFVRIPAGKFLMGCEREGTYDWEQPVHRVRITQDYYMGKYPVTQAVWSAVLNGFYPSRFKGEQRPVERVSWQDIVEGGQDDEMPISFLSMLEQNYPVNNPILKNWHFRLPTEAEWEYSARANSPYKYSGSDYLKRISWFDQNSCGSTKEVGLKSPNAFGLYDMSGNVWEWCQDWFDLDYYNKCKEEGIIENPLNCEESEERVVRGGAWSNYSRFCRVSYRDDYVPTNRSFNIGFRLVLAPSSAD